MVNDFLKVKSLVPIQDDITRYYHLPNMSGNLCNTTVTAILNLTSCISPLRLLQLLLYSI